MCGSVHRGIGLAPRSLLPMKNRHLAKSGLETKAGLWSFACLSALAIDFAVIPTF